VVWLASSRMCMVCGHTCPSAESRREFGIGADDCVSSIAAVLGLPGGSVLHAPRSSPAIANARCQTSGDEARAIRDAC
jgi:hypothetical protein